MKKKFLALVISLSLLISVCCLNGISTVAAGRNLIVNSGFEMGDYGYEGEFELAVHNDTALFSGKVPVGKFAKQAFSNLAPNTEYHFSAWIFLDGDTIYKPTIVVKGYGGPEIYSNCGACVPYSWTYNEIVFTTGAEIGDVEVSVWNNSDMEIYTDDFSLTGPSNTDNSSGIITTNTNLWVNPGYENGTTDGYAADGSVEIVPNAVFPPHGGGNSVRLSTGGYIKTTVNALKPNATYTAYAQVYLTKNSSAQPKIAVNCAGKEIVIGGDGYNLGGSWSREKLVFTTGDDTSAEIAILNTSNCEMFVDDLVLTEGADPNVANRILNPGFETSTYDGWVSSGVVVSENSNSGNYCVQVIPGCSAEQDVQGLIVGEKYILTAYVKAPTGVVLGIKGNGFDYHTVVVNDNYVKATISFEAVAETARIYLWNPLGDGSGTAAWGDDFTLSSPTPNLCEDSGFESGSYAQYRGQFAIVDNNTFPPHSGKYSAQVSEGNSVIKDFVNLKPNTEYTYSAWVYITDNEIYPNIVIKGYGGADIYSKVFATPGKWLQNVISFTTGPNNTTAEIAVWNSTNPGGYIYVDDIMMVAPSELVGFKDVEVTADKYIKGIAPLTKVADFINNTDVASANTNILLRNGSAHLGYDDNVGTGSKIDVVYDGTTVSTYTALIMGDLNGDGAINGTDLVQLRKHILGADSLSGDYLSAAKLGETSQNEISIIELIRLKKLIVALS